MLTVIDLQMYVGRAVALLDTLQRRQLGANIVSDGIFLGMRRLVSATMSGISWGLQETHTYKISSRKTSLSPAMISSGGSPPRYPRIGETQG